MLAEAVVLKACTAEIAEGKARPETMRRMEVFASAANMSAGAEVE